MRNSRVEWHYSEVDRLLKFSGQVDPRDVLDLRLDRLDRMVIDSPVETAADLFQTLQILFFRAQQQAEMADSVGIPTGTPLE